jgi:membrane-bound serine protease (ClpP class)
VKKLIADVIRRAQACGRKVGICGQAPSDYPEFARFLVECGIDSISLNPDTAVLKTTLEIVEMERGLPGAPPQREKDDEKAPSKTPMEEKILNDTVAWARSLAELRGRSAEWATRAVKESLSAPASEAVRDNAVDLMADDLKDLLAKIDGREVTLPTGKIRLRTADAEIRQVEMWWGDRILAVLSNPNVALILLIFGFYGILFELYTPGWGVAGVLGVVSISLAFLGLAILPINSVGLVLIAVALALFLAEVFVTSFGALTIGGIFCLILGGIMLVDSPAGFTGVSLQVLIPIAVATGGITFFLVSRIVKTFRRGVQTGSEEMVGKMAHAVDDFAQDHEQWIGTIQTHGELWNAVASTAITKGQSVEILSRDGLSLTIRVTE